MRKKICFFIGYYPFVKGGAEFQSKLIAEKLKQEYDIFFISVSKNHKKNDIIEHDGFKIYQLNYNLNVNKVLLYYPLSREINKILRAENPQIIYQRILNSFSYHLANYAFKNKIKHFIHVADKYSLIFDDKSISTSVRRVMFNNLKLTNTEIITQNVEQSNLLLKHNIKPVLQVYNMHPVPELNLDDLRKFKLESLTKNIVWIGSSRPVKRLELFIDLAQEFINKKNIKFNIIGRLENNPYSEILKARIMGLNNLDYLGEKENDFVNDFLLKSSYLTINTSSSEGFSNVFIQSWLRGVPVLSLNSNPDDLFNDYKLGEFCNDNLEFLKNKLSYYLNNESEYIEASNESFLVSKKLFSLNDSIQNIEKLL